MRIRRASRRCMFGLASLLAVQACSHALGPGDADRADEQAVANDAIVVADGRYVMGTVLEVELPSTSRDRPRLERAVEAAFESAVELDRLLSRFDPASEISRLNARAGLAATQVDPRVREILEVSRRASTATHGAFDVTVGPVIALWTLAASRGRAPDAVERAAAVAHVGADRIEIAADGRVALAEAMSIDLGGIAKGFALDRIAEALRAGEVTPGLLSFGQSSVHALGAPPGSDAWRLLLRAPDGGFAGVVALRDRAFSVSSSLDPASEIDGVLYGHIVDPRTGFALTQRGQAAVVSRSATLAEVLSKALLVLDEREGRAVLAAHAAEAFVIDARGASWQSAGWQRETRFAPLLTVRPSDRPQ